jgi:hypothetical protein
MVLLALAPVRGPNYRGPYDQCRNSYHDEDGRVSKWQIALGNGCYYLFKMEIGEVAQELPGITVINDRELLDYMDEV